MPEYIYEFRLKKPSEMRYKTVGDWFYQTSPTTGHTWTTIEAIDLGDEKMNFLLLFHELVEEVLCKAHRITQEEVDEFDQEMQDEQVSGTEIGEMSEAPYHEEHMVATSLETLMCQLLGVDWNEYNNKVEEASVEVDAYFDELEIQAQERKEGGSVGEKKENDEQSKEEEVAEDPIEADEELEVALEEIADNETE